MHARKFTYRSQADTLGMDAASVSIFDSNAQEQWRVDVPMRTFQGGMKNLSLSVQHLLTMFQPLVRLLPSTPCHVQKAGR